MRVLFAEGLVANKTMSMYFLHIQFLCACLFVCTSVLFVLCLLASNTLLMCLLLTYIILVDMFMGKFELFGENILPNNVLCMY